jgi:hypothetical protein
MPRMLDLIRDSKVPASLMHAAARGSLSVLPAETIEILVYLARHHKGLGEQARLTLAGWDEKASLAAASDSAASAEVLGYFASFENLRTELLPALAENPSVTVEALSEVASRGTRPMVEALLKSPRVLNSQVLLMALQSNAGLHPDELAEVGHKLAALRASAAAATNAETGTPDAAAEETLVNFLKENAAELESEKDKPFHPIGGIHDESGMQPTAALFPVPAAAMTAVPAPGTAAEARATPGTAAAIAAAHAKQQAGPGHVEKRDSTLQKIAKLDVRARITLAVRGSKEERSILIRDGTKLVALAVLESPKVSDGEVEGFALQKNVLEAVLRQIPLKRRFAKNYNIMRNLVYNPRTPLDLSLGLMKGLLVHDLKNLSGNKEVPETIRKLALRMFKQKVEKKGH